MLLKVENLRKGFASPAEGRREVVAIDHFEIEQGERVVLQGPSGSGKSTFLNCLVGFLKPDRGGIRFMDTDYAALKSADFDRLRAQRIGFLRQRPALFAHLSVREHLIFAANLAERSDAPSAVDGAEIVGLGDHLDFRPPQLSLGQQQRLALGCVLVRQPALILADEPTAHLDSEATNEVLDLLFENCRAQEAALLMVTHDSEAAQRFDQRLDWAELNTLISA